MSFHSVSPLECFCGRAYTNPTDLEEHRRARGHFSSHVCGKYCIHPGLSLDNVQIHKCGCCSKICERLDILEDHRISTGHCFCSDCELPFGSQSALEIHRQTEAHASEFKCCDCNIFFKDIHALNAHMASRAHRKPLRQKPPEKIKKTIAISAKDKVCNECQQSFTSSLSLRQHCESVKHKPLSALSCPIGKGCQRKFTSPSALLHHLESGHCRSGMNRDEINRIVQSCDQDHVIHSHSTLVSPSSPTFSACGQSPYSEFSMVYPDDQSEWSLITPELSQGITEDNLVQWSLLEGSEISFERRLSGDATPTATLRCPTCPKGSKSFATAQALQQHMDSPAHCDKIYLCPSIIFATAPSKTEKIGKKEKQFSTLSGLAQHLESGACRGGKRTFSYCINLIQHHLEQLGFRGMRVLLPGVGT